jgi:aspartokinase
MESAEILTNENLVALSIICDVNAHNIEEIFSFLDGKPVYGISSGRNSVTIFTINGNVAEIINKLHSISDFRAISHRENIAMIQVNDPVFVDSPGGIARISTVLSQAGINIIEVTTSKATINVFIEENQIKRAKEAIENVV